MGAKEEAQINDVTRVLLEARLRGLAEEERVIREALSGSPVVKPRKVARAKPDVGPVAPSSEERSTVSEAAKKKIDKYINGRPARLVSK